MTPVTPQSRTASTRHATLLVLVMMAVSASPGLFRDGVSGGPRSLIENRQVLAPGKDGGQEQRVNRRDLQDDETRPASSQPSSNFVALANRGTPVCGLPFAIASGATTADARPCARWQVVILYTSRPPPMV